MQYIVIEIQTGAQGTVSCVVNSYGTEAEALNKYYTVLSFAVISSVPIHSCSMLTEEGKELRHDCFKHQPMAEPEAAAE